MRKITYALAFLLLATAELVGAQGNTWVRFRNLGSETVFVITDVGPNRDRSNFQLEPGRSESIYVGYVSLFWCSYKGRDTGPCKPGSPAYGGALIDVR